MFSNEAIKRMALQRCTSIEFIITEKCQNACKYCYRVKKHALSPYDMLDPEHLRLYIRKLKEMFGDDVFRNREVELFGGDPLLDYDHTCKILEVLDQEVSDEIIYIGMPTNGRLLQEITMHDIEHLLSKTKVPVGFSFSVDVIDTVQRNLSNTGSYLSYNEEINLDMLIKLAKEGGHGFHPMLDFSTIDKWFDQFKTFFDAGVRPYLLEVRHPLSKEQAIEAVRQMVRIRYYIDKHDPKSLRHMNTIAASTVPRGLGCSAHTSLCITIDGKIPFCHRVLDPPWICGNLLTGDLNLSKFVFFKAGFDHRNHVACLTCPVRFACTGQCAGASYEYWGDPWTPIESICNYTKLKIFVMTNLFPDWITLLTESVQAGRFYKQGLVDEIDRIFGYSNVMQLIEELKTWQKEDLI